MTNNSPISAVRLQITVNDVKGCRKITLKGLYGDAELLKVFITQFRIFCPQFVFNNPYGGEKEEKSTNPHYENINEQRILHGVKINV